MTGKAPSDTAAASLAERAAALRAELTRLDHAYHTLDAPLALDADYDALFRELQAIEQQHPELQAADSPTLRVGGAPRSDLPTVSHDVPMLSLGNAFDDAGIVAFDRRVGEGLGVSPVRYAVELKFDGLAVTLRYEQGLLTRAATRGDGSVGKTSRRTLGPSPRCRCDCTT